MVHGRGPCDVRLGKTCYRKVERQFVVPPICNLAVHVITKCDWVWLWSDIHTVDIVLAVVASVKGSAKLSSNVVKEEILNGI